MKLTHLQYAHVIDRLLALDGWRPDVDSDEMPALLDVLARADSQLELMYILSVIHFLEVRAFALRGPVRLPVAPVETEILGRRHPALWILEPWDGFACLRCGEQHGPSGLILVPQLTLRGYAWDLGIITTSDNGATDGTLLGVAQFDGYRVHRTRRRTDELKRRRLAGAGVPVFSCYEETHAPAVWFDAVIHWFHAQSDSPTARSCPGFRAADVIVPVTQDAA